MLSENKFAIVHAFRSMVKAKLMLWDESCKLEKLIGFDVDSGDELIEFIACGLDDAEGAMSLSEESIMGWVKEMAN